MTAAEKATGKEGAAGAEDQASARALLDQIIDASIPEPKITEAGRTLDQLEKREIAIAKQARERAREQLLPNLAAIDPIIQSIAARKLTVSKTTIAAINERIGRIDTLLAKQVTPILHHPKFQKLEASWRGLEYLLSQTRPRATMKLKVLNAREHELAEDFENPWTSSALFRKVYERGLDQAGGIPYSALLGDYEFSHDNLGLLKSISAVAAAAHAPFISAASPKMFKLDSFRRFHADMHARQQTVSQVLDSERVPEWATFRSSADARYCVLTIPHILMRLPYGIGAQASHGVAFDEAIDAKKHSDYLWGNAGYALASRLIAAFDATGWFARISGMKGGGLVENLPVHRHAGGVTYGVETIWPDGRESELASSGFAALVGVQNSSEPVYYGAPTVFDPTIAKTSTDDNLKQSHELSSGLPYILIASRFAHYLKVILRQTVGSTTNAEELQANLQRWISQYANNNENAGRELLARKPLRQAKVTVTMNKSRPGVYEAVVKLKPHFQLKEIQVQLSLVADIP